MTHYLKKQLIIAGIFLVIIILIIGIFYLFTIPTRGTCFDGKQNQRETGVDCGGPCGHCEEPEDLIVVFQKFIPTTEHEFDLIAQIENPNRDWGIESLTYKFNLYDKNNKLINFIERKTYFLPQETDYIIEQRVSLVSVPSAPTPVLDRIELELKDISWQKLKDFEELDLIIEDKNYQLIDDKSQLSGNIENKSNFDLDKIEIIGLLLSNGEIIAAGRTEIRTVLMGQTRYFEITWPYQFIEVSSFKIKARTNVFLNDNFLKIHGTPERFKEY